jgi:hypothetical protein
MRDNVITLEVEPDVFEYLLKYGTTLVTSQMLIGA